MADDGTVSFEQYDNLMTREVRLGVVMSVFISGAVFWKWGTVHPLIAMCVMQVSPRSRGRPAAPIQRDNHSP